MKEYDVIVVGLGAGGVGAAIELSWDKNLKIAAIEKEERIGGTMIAGGVNCFEPGIAVGRVQKSLCESLLAKGKGRVQKSLEGYPCDGNPYAISLDYNDSYVSTLRRGNLNERTQCRRFMFDDQAMEMEILNRLKENGVDLYQGYALLSSKVEDRQIKKITIQNSSGERQELCAKYFIDCTGNVELAYLSGCKTALGQETREIYGEEIAPLEESGEINGVSLLFKMSKTAEKEYTFSQEIDEIDVSAWENDFLKKDKVFFCANAYPNGDFNINMLPTMTGKEYFSLPRQQADKICLARVKKFSEWIEKYEHFKGYKLKYIFPMAGVREDRKIVGKYVLTLKDVLTCPSLSTKKESFIAYSDHIIDMHGCTGARPPINFAYGIPYACLQTNEIDNMLVASKGASFSHIAASSCRLSRTIMDLGEAAGKACKTAILQGKALHESYVKADIFKGYEKIGEG